MACCPSRSPLRDDLVIQYANMSIQQSLLSPLTVSSVAVIASYRWKEQFSALEEAIKYVAAISELVGDDSTPLDQIQVMVEFTSGESERCAYASKERTIQWMSRFKIAS